MLERCSRYDMGSPYETEAPKCSIINMDPTLYPVLTIEPKCTHDSTKKLFRCIDPGNVKPDIDYLPENVYYYYFG